jgi:hypothetical protein
MFLLAKWWDTRPCCFFLPNDEIRTNTKIPLFLVIRQNLLQHLCLNPHFQIFNQNLATVSLYTFSSSVVICANNYLSARTNFHTLSLPVLLSSFIVFPTPFKPLTPLKNIPTLSHHHEPLSHLQFHSQFCLNLPKTWCKCTAHIMRTVYTSINTTTSPTDEMQRNTSWDTTA